MRILSFRTYHSIGRWAQQLRAAPSRPGVGHRTLTGGMAMFLLCLLTLLPFGAHAQTTYGEEAKTRLQLAERVAPLTEDSAFGEQIGQFNGSVSFRYVDVSLPGNDGLKVEFARVSNNEYSPNFWGWDIDIPKITSVMPELWDQGWTPDPPDEVYNQNNVEFKKKDYWNGFRFRIDGQTTTLLRKHSDPRIPAVPFTSEHVFMTKSGWVFEAVPAVGRPGSSLVGLAPNGLRYHFDHLITDVYDTVTHPTKVEVVTTQVPGGTISNVYPQTLPRDIYVLYVSRIEDRFNNSVTFQWEGSKLNRIVASDGRTIEIVSEKVSPIKTDLRHEVKQVKVGGRTWTYNRAPLEGTAEVINPDGSKWEYSGSWFGLNSIQYDRTVPVQGGERSLLEDIATCTKAYPFSANQVRHRSVKAPSGATAQYVVVPMRHGRSKVPLACVATSDDEATWTSRIPHYVDEWTLQQKTVTGPGLQTLVTNYAYDGLNIAFDPADQSMVTMGDIWTPAFSLKTVTATRSDGRVRTYRFGRVYGEDEGLLRAEDVKLQGQSAPARRTEYDYVPPSDNATQAFAQMYGYSDIGFGDQFSNFNVPQRRVVVHQDDASFTSEVLAFNQFVAPVSLRKSSSLGYSRTENSQPYNNTSLWVLGQPGTNSVDGTQTLRVEYHTNALPHRFFAFAENAPSQTLTYNNGLVSSVTDARGKVLTLDDWYRGVPGSIVFDDQTSVSAAVDDNGWVRSVTDQVGNRTCYEYDAMGRTSAVLPPPRNADCESVAPPGEAWNPTHISFVPQADEAMGLPAGHWLRTESRGAYRKLTRYDAFWRPVIDHEYDNSDIGDTQRFRGWKYDADGQTTFEGYPRSTAGSVASFSSQGVTSSYDALGRPLSISRHSELGALVTQHSYLAGFRAEVRDARGLLTRFSYQAFDAPDTSRPVRIESPEGATTTIVRDLFGKPSSMRREGNFDGSPVSATRSYVYDAQQRLCKRIEPETGSTVMAYDPAGNLEWTASGLNLPSTSSCDLDSVTENLRVKRTYDDLNRVLTLRFPDGLGDQNWAYTPDGKPETVTTWNADSATVVNGYQYNTLRLLKREELTQNGATPSALTYAYSGNAHLARITYPSSLGVDYQPNALGQATQASSYAVDVAYYPNGAIERFTYGNGLVHTLTQNARGLPERSRSALGATVALDDTYDFDENGNVAAISDALPGQRGNRDMDYDGLDRLISTVSPMFGTAAYTYDPLDNLRTVSVSAGAKARNHRYVYDANQRLAELQDVDKGSTAAIFGYDVQGNLRLRDTQEYSFDFGNRLREVPGIESYRYDGHGRRVLAVHPNEGAIHSFYGNDGVLRTQRDERAGKSTDFIYLGGSMVARVSTAIDGLPGVPTLTVPDTSTTGSYTVSWTAPDGASFYRLEESANSAPFEEIEAGPGLNRSISGKPEGSYSYRVRACVTNVPSTCGAFSNVETITVAIDVSVPPPPILSADPLVNTGDYELSWTTPTGATFYRLEELIAGSYSEIQATAANSLAVIGKPPGSYSYRVRACASSVPSTCSDYSNVVTVTVTDTTPLAPTIFADPNNTTGSYVVSWTPVNGATVYRLEEQSNGGPWQEILADGLTSRGIGPRANGVYGYRVRACQSRELSTCGAYSNVVTVTVNTVILPPPPVLSAPSSSSNGTFTVTWTASANATRYRLEEQSNGGAWNEIQHAAGLLRTISDKPSGTYAYRVRACLDVNVTSCGTYSNVAQVVVARLPDPPSLIAPSSSTSGSYNVNWSMSSDATHYRLEHRHSYTDWTEIANITVLFRSFSNQPSDVYEYRVRACASATNVNACGAYSFPRTVTVNRAGTPPAPTISGPNGAPAGTNFALNWTAISSASSYQLEGNVNGGVWNILQTNASTSHTRQEPVNGFYRYRVRACSSIGCGLPGNVHLVQVQPVSQLPSHPVVTAPVNPFNGNYTVSWTQPSGANWYRLEESDNNGATFELVYEGPNSSTPITGRPQGTYLYRARACISSDLATCGGYSDDATVVVGPMDPMDPPYITLPASSTTGTYNVIWDTSTGAGSYKLEERVNGGAFVQIMDENSTSHSFFNKPAGAYSYRVRACRALIPTDCSNYSQIRTITVTAATALSAPTLITPNSASVGISFSIGWSPVTGASSYTLEKSRNRGAFNHVYTGSATSRLHMESQSGSWTYRVKACAGSACSAWSHTRTVLVN